MRRSAVTLALLLTATAAATATAPTTASARAVADRRDDGGPLDLRRVEVRQEKATVVFSVRTWGRFGAADVTRGDALCLVVTPAAPGAPPAKICVVRTASGRLGLAAHTAGRTPGPVRPLEATLTRPDPFALVARFRALDGGLRDGGFTWSVQSDLDAAPNAAPAADALHLLRVFGPRVVARAIPVRVHGDGADPGGRVAIEQRAGRAWRHLRTLHADALGHYAARVRLRGAPLRLTLRAALAGARASAPARVRARDVTLASLGDINMGDGVGDVMDRLGPRYPWSGVAPVLRAADIGFGNLECAVSNRGTRFVKTFNFRGKASSLRQVRDYAGMDVLNMANNHAGDYGRTALVDTRNNVLRFGMLPVGAGRDAAEAARPAIITRLGMRIAFVGFSDIGPYEFGAGAHYPGTQLASIAAIRRGVRAARRHADIVVMTMHAGIERDPNPSDRQRAFAAAAIGAGAVAVIGAHPHVLQPIVRPRARRVVAYSLGNFVWSAGSGFTARTGILVLSLSGRGVEHSRFRHATIFNTRPHF